MPGKFRNVPRLGAGVDPMAEQAKLQQAVSLHQMGQLPLAQALYEDVLRTNPRQVDALHLLGIVASQRGDYKRAADLIGKAIKFYPKNPAFHFNRGLALQGLKKCSAAVTCFDAAIAIQPNYAEAYFGRGNAQVELKQFDAAVASFDRAISINPHFVDALVNRGNALKEQKKFDASLASYNRAIELRPDRVDAYFNLGVAYQELDQFDAAIASYNRAIVLKSDYAAAYSNRGNALRELKQFDEAIASYDRAIAIAPEFAEVHYNRGVALHDLNRFEDSIASYDRAIAIRPNYVEAYSNRGNALKELRKFDSAISSFDQAIAIDPEYAEAYFNKSVALLLAGDFGGGWKLYEWRWRRSTFTSPKRDFTQPLWLGRESLSGKTILLHSEQGLGDTIQFCRYASSVAALGARVIMEAEKPLVRLLMGVAGVTEVIEKGNPLPAFDCHCPLLSLPLAFDTNLDSIPHAKRYLNADTGDLSHWAERLGEKTKPRVGLVWSGSVANTNDRNRSILLAHLLSRLPTNCQYVSLHKDVRDVDKLTLDAYPDVLHFGNEQRDFADAACLCELMDVVIGVDTSVAHLSGAMGIPTWILLSHVADWRWMLDRADTPWYEKVRLYRQARIDDWDDVFSRIGTDLAQIESRINPTGP